MRKIIGSIDIGSDTIKLVVGEVINNKVNILSAFSEETKGFQDHTITNEDELVDVIKKMLSKANDKLGFQIKKLIANIPVSENNFVISEVANTITNEDGVVSGEDILRVMQSAAYNKIKGREELVGVLPIYFRVDDNETDDPYGKLCQVLTLKCILVTAPKYEVYDIIRVLEKCDINVVDITTSGLVDYYNFKNHHYDDRTGIVINLGEYKTNLSVFSKGIFINSEVIDTGGAYIDRDISFIYGINKKEAKNLKEQLALASIRRANPKDNLRIINNAREELIINQYELSEIVANKLEDILKLSKNSINLLTKKEISFIIITGGLTEIKDFPIALASVFGDTAKVGSINTIGIRNNKYSSALGMIKYFNEKLNLRHREYSTVSDNDARAMVNIDMKAPSGDTILGKVFGYFFDN